MKNLCLTVLLFGASVHADILQVPTQYKTIQLAIDNAADGDAIHISSGTYYEALNTLGKAVQLIGVNGPDATIIDATGTGASTIVCNTNEGAKTVISGLTITGGSGTEHPIQATAITRGGVICQCTVRKRWATV